MDALNGNCYNVLGVSKNASPDTVRNAFRARILQNHPDHNPKDPEAAARTRSLIEAYQMLTKPARNRSYKCEVQITYDIGYPSCEISLPVWMQQCLAIAVFFTLILGAFGLAAHVIDSRKTVFRPMTNVIIPMTLDPPAADLASARGDQQQAIGYSTVCH